MSEPKRIDVRLAIAHSLNFATSKLDSGSAEREHIIGLCSILGRRETAFTELIEAARTYFNGFCQDEASDVLVLDPDGRRRGQRTGCDEEQVKAAHRMGAALAEVEPYVKRGKPGTPGDPIRLADQLTEEANALLALAGMLRGGV